MANIKNAERKDWNFGHFGTRHDGTVWNLIRIKDADTGLPVSDETPIASNKSATPLVALAREMNTSEKRAIKIRKLRSQVQQLTAELAALESELDITPEDAKAVLDAIEAEKLTGKALKARAAELGIKGRGKMTADELRAAVAAA